MSDTHASRPRIVTDKKAQVGHKELKVGTTGVIKLMVQCVNFVTKTPAQCSYLD